MTHASRLFQTHTFERMEERAERPRALPQCPAHPHETVSFIAQDGVTLMCRDCVLIGAGAGGAPADLVQGAIPLRDAAMLARSRLGAVVEVVQHRSVHVRDMQRSVAAVVTEVQVEVLQPQPFNEFASQLNLGARYVAHFCECLQADYERISEGIVSKAGFAKIGL